jgi:hypothetical protein
MLMSGRIAGETLPVLRRWAAAVERRRLMRGRLNFKVNFSRIAVAASLWDYGEDGLADKALRMTDAELRHAQAIAANYENPAHALPMTGQHVTHNHVTAFAAITYFEAKFGR